MHKARARRKAALERHPRRLLHRSADITFLGCGHYLSFRSAMIFQAFLSEGTLKTVATFEEAPASAAEAYAIRRHPRLPGGANATIRSRACFGRNPVRSGPVNSSTPKALIHQLYFVSSGDASGATVRFGRRQALAPFVYRLGRHPFTVERAVRFR